MEQQTNITANPKLEQALALLQMGWSVIPVGRNKKPLIEWKKYQTEMPTHEEVNGWFEKYPYVNLGLVTGKISGIVVVDIDPRHGGTDEMFRDLRTVKVKTGGGGQHVYFKYEEGIENKAGIQPGVDVRGEGGYAVTPPSEHESGNCYEWINGPDTTEILPLPDFVKEWINAGQTEVESKAAEIINGVPEGKRNNSAASVVGKLLIKYPRGEWETEVWPLLLGWNSKNDPPLPENELRAVYESIVNKESAKPDNPKGKLKIKSKADSKADADDDDIIFTSFFVTADGRIGEEIFNPVKREPEFAVYNGSDISYSSVVKDGERVIRPIDEPFITSGKVKLPAAAAEYGTELELFNEIKNFIHAYVDIAPEWEEWASHYVLLSWIYDKLPVCPYLCALGPSDCGKTRLVQTVGIICYKPIVASGSITASPVFRLLDRFRGTLIINEFDYLGNYDDEMIVILNNGFEEGLPVWRTEGDKEKEVRSFDVYGPKLFASRKRRNDWAFESRLLTVPMKATKRPDIPPFLLEEFKTQADELRNKLLTFRLKHYGQEVNFHTDRFKGISGRLRQTLLSITAVIKDEAFLARAEEFALKTQKELKAMKGLDLDGAVYQVLQECWEGNDKRPLIKDIAKKVKEVAELEKLSSKAVGNIIRDELGFQTSRSAHGGNFLVILTKDQLDTLSERYEDHEVSPEVTSPSSPSSQQAQENEADGEVGEFGELSIEYQSEVENLVVAALVELTGTDGYVRGYDMAQKSGCPYLWVKNVLEALVAKKKALQLEDGKDMWAATLATRDEFRAAPTGS